VQSLFDLALSFGIYGYAIDVCVWEFILDVRFLVKAQIGWVGRE
jgi:hypothetical protein